MNSFIFLISVVLSQTLFAEIDGKGGACSKAVAPDTKVFPKYVISELHDLNNFARHQASIEKNMTARLANQPAHYQQIRRQVYKLRAELDTGNISGAITRMRSLVTNVLSSYHVLQFLRENPIVGFEKVDQQELAAAASAKEHQNLIKDLQTYDLYRALILTLESAAKGESTDKLTQDLSGLALQSTTRTLESVVQPTSLDNADAVTTRQKTAAAVIAELERTNQDIQSLVPTLGKLKMPSTADIRDLVDRIDLEVGESPLLSRIKQKSDLEKQAKKAHNRDAFFEAFYQSPPGKLLGKLIYSELAAYKGFLLLGGQHFLRFFQRMANDRFSYRHFDAIDQLVIDFQGRSLDSHYKFLQMYSAPSKFGKAALVAYFRHLGTLGYREKFMEHVRKQGDEVFTEKCEQSLLFAKHHGVLDAFERNPLRHTEVIIAAGGGLGSALLGTAWYMYNTFDTTIEEIDE